MKILFLHLSDAHIKQDTNISKINPQAIVNSLAQVGNFDECVIIFSGDITQSGNMNEYKVAELLFGKIIKGIADRFFDKKKQINTLVVPGNHDNLSKNIARNHNDIKGYYDDKKTDIHYYEDLEELNNFYDFAHRNKCFNKNKNIEVKILKYKNFTIKVNLINSAPFSILGSDNGDKGLHYLPDRELLRMDYDAKENYTISIMHHSPEWFSDATKKALYNKINKNTDLLFIGHEHFSLNEHKNVNGNQLDISSGVALYGTKTEHGFNTLILDTKERTLISKKFIYNGTIYKPSNEEGLKNNNIIFRGKNKFIHSQEFQKYLETDIEQREGNSYLDYFVFPTLETKNMDHNLKDINVSTEEKFIEIMKSNPNISIEGTLKAGKTTLAKYLCLKLSDEYIPLLLTEDDFGTKKNENVIKNALEEQYGKDADYDEYMQLESNKKVLIVDRNDRIKKVRWESFYEEFQNKFGYLIFFTGVNWNLNIKEKTLEEFSEDKFIYFKISPFYYGKRKELIEKVYDSMQDRRFDDRQEIVRKINDEITSQIKYFQLNPDFIHQYVNYYLNFSFMKTQNDKNVFNKVFEANITFRLTQNTREENVDEILVALDFVAHHIHFNKKYPLPIEEFKEAIQDYNTIYDNNLNSKMVYDVALKSNIIKEIPDEFGIEFCDENLLAYFTALHLNRKFNEGKGIEELNYILNNICFEINGDIILFLSYITSNVEILETIMKSMVNLMNEWDEFSLDNKNIVFLTKRPTIMIKQNVPDEKAKKENIEKKTKAEKEFIEEKQKDSDSLYSYDETKVNSFENKITKSLRYMELVSKILPNFRHILGGDKKKVIVEILYKYPNKLLYFMLKDIDENFDKIIKDILSKDPKTKRGMLITQGMLEKSLQTQAMMYVLSIYDFVASTASIGKGILELNKFDYLHNSNYMLENIMMEENVANFHNFSKKVEYLYDNTDMDILKEMIGMIVRKYYLNHEVILKSEGQRLADKFFGQEDRKKLQIKQARNRFMKK